MFFFQLFDREKKIKAGPNSKHLQMTNVVKKIELVYERVKNSKGNGENADKQHFILFSQCFQKFSRVCRTFDYYAKVFSGLVTLFKNL